MLFTVNPFFIVYRFPTLYFSLKTSICIIPLSMVFKARCPPSDQDMLVLGENECKQAFLPRSPAPAETSFAASHMACDYACRSALLGKQKGRWKLSDFREPSFPLFPTYTQNSSGLCGQSCMGFLNLLQNAMVCLYSCNILGSFGTSCCVSIEKAHTSQGRAWHRFHADISLAGPVYLKGGEVMLKVSLLRKKTCSTEYINCIQLVYIPPLFIYISSSLEKSLGHGRSDTFYCLRLLIQSAWLYFQELDAVMVLGL